MSGKYAASTTVSSERSRGEIEGILSRYGATTFMYGWEADKAMIMFEADGRRIRFLLPMPKRDDPAFTTHSRGQRAPDAALALWEQACRQKWRALALVIKAKLEAVAAGISVFEDEFLANVLLPGSGGQTAGEWLRPQLAQHYQAGTLPPMLPAPGK